MNPYVAEFCGTALLLLLGNGVVANVLLTRTKGHGGGPIVITFGWAMAVYTAVLCTQDASGAHLNPAVTVGFVVAALAGLVDFEVAQAPGYIISQMAGGIVGGSLVWLFYRPHYALTEDANRKLGTFCTAPEVRSVPDNLFSEVVGTFILVFAALMMTDAVFTWDEVPDAREVKVGLGSVGAVRIGLIVLAIGLSLGGTTGYAINPARDLGPRIAHAMLPIPGKRDSDWGYSWIPVVGPLLGGLLAGGAYMLVGAAS